MTKPAAATLFGAISLASSFLTVQIPQYAVWFGLAGMISAYLLKSPFFAPPSTEKPS